MSIPSTERSRTRASRSCGRAREEQEQALAKAPGDRSLLSELLRTREALSGLYFLTGKIQPDDRIREYQQILRERQDLAGGDPSSLRLRNEVGRSAALLAGLLLEAGRAKDALEVLEQARPAHEALLQADRDRCKDEWKRRTEPVEPDSVLNRPMDNNSQGGLFQQQFIFARGIQNPVIPVSFEFRRQWAELLALKGAALAAINPLYASSYVDDQIRNIEASAYACFSGFNFLTLVSNIAGATSVFGALAKSLGNTPADSAQRPDDRVSPTLGK